MTLWQLILQINLKQYVARMTEHYTFEAPVSSANLCFQSAHLGNASYLTVQVDIDSERLEYTAVDLPGQPASVSCVSVSVPNKYASHTPMAETDFALVAEAAY